MHAASKLAKLMIDNVTYTISLPTQIGIDTQE